MIQEEKIVIKGNSRTDSIYENVPTRTSSDKNMQDEGKHKAYPTLERRSSSISSSSSNTSSNAWQII